MAVKFDRDFYMEEFLRYFSMAATQQKECNLGTIPHLEGTVKDDLMRHVQLYDVVERKYAGFTQVLLDLWYGDTPDHPYCHKLHDVRKPIAKKFGKANTKKWELPEWLYVFLIHRVTGSGIDYAKQPSGYNNTILPLLEPSTDLGQLVVNTSEILQTDVPAYTSVGYQFPAFPKKKPPYKRGGDYFLAEFAHVLATDLADFLWRGPKKTLRQVGDFMFAWNAKRGLRAYRFQYAALISDIADFFPELVDTWSHFYYGKNAVECLSFLTWGKKGLKDMDAAVDILVKATGGKPYNIEDGFCDFIRWVENYIRPGHAYEHLDRDAIWNSSLIVDHPYGRQKYMLELKLVDSFNSIPVHPSDDYVLKRAGLSVEDYRELVFS